MAGTKRRRGASKFIGDASDPRTPNVVWKVLTHLMELSKSKSQCSATLQAFGDGKCWLEEGAPTATTSTAMSTSTSSKKSKKQNKESGGDDANMTHADCYWVVLGTHIMNRLLLKVRGSSSSSSASASLMESKPASNRTPTEIGAAVVLSCLATSLATILVVDKGRLEKACASSASTSAAATSRSIVGRTLLTTTVACMAALDILVELQVTSPSTSSSSSSSSVSIPHPIIHAAIKAATVALDRVVHLGLQNNHHKTAISRGFPDTEPQWKLEELQRMCQQIEEDESSEPERVCLNGLEELGGGGQQRAVVSSSSLGGGESMQTLSPSSSPAVAAASPSSSKRTRRSATTKGKKSSTAMTSSSSSDAVKALSKNFHALIQSTNIRLDGRVAVKRWASMALVWFCQGQAQLLKHVSMLLEQDNDHKEQLQQQHQPDEPNPTYLNPLDLISISCRLLSVVSESGNHCGIRPPTGGMQQYVKAILQDKRKKTPPRLDIRDLTALVIYQLLQHHGYCLKLISADPLKQQKQLGSLSQKQEPRLVVNDIVDGDGGEKKDTKLSLRYYPLVHSVVSNLCRTAACGVATSSPSSSSTSSSSDQGDGVKRLLTLAAAFSFQLAARLHCPLDCKLTHFAISHLADSLRSVEVSGTILGQGDTEDEAAGDDSKEMREQRSLTKKFQLDSKLGIPHRSTVVTSLVTSSKSKKKQSATAAAAGVGSSDEVTPTPQSEPSDCTYAGMFAAQTEPLTDEHVVAFFLRALINSSSAETPASLLLSTLTEIIGRAYDTRKLRDLAKEEDGEERKHHLTKPTGTKKRQATSSPKGGRRRKRARRHDNEIVDSEDFPDEIGDDDSNYSQSWQWSRLNSARALLATEALNSLRLTLLIQQKPSSTLLQSIRRSLTVEHIGNIITLGVSLDRALVKTRANVQAKVASPDATQPPDSMAFFQGGNSYDFTHYEKNLWSAHMNMCVILGRGQSTFDSNRASSFSSARILGDSDRRTEIYRAVATSCEGQGTQGTSDQPQWPLSLPAAHFAFMASNLTSEPYPTGRDDSGPDRHIAKGYIESIGSFLHNLQALKRPRKVDVDKLFLDDEIPLSLRDARLFAVAFSRLPLEDQRHCLEKLLHLTFIALTEVKEDKSKLANLVGNGEASTFLARILVTCSSIVSISTVGAGIRELLFSQVGPFQVQPPSFLTTAEWYRSDRCFMGMFSDWESPGLPEVPNAPTSLTGLSPQSLTEFKSLLHLCFSVGFLSARHDQCHLLFASWNCLGFYYSYLDKSQTSSEVSALALDAVTPIKAVSAEDLDQNLSERILQMREDVCMLHRDIHRGTASPLRINSNLRSMLGTAENLLESVLASYVTDDEAQKEHGVPASVFCLLASIPTYISSSVAGHTKPGNDYFSTTLSKVASRRAKRQRGYSSGSDRIPSDGDSVETDGGGFESDARVDALSRLRECCDACGAAPIHPDWLDVSCRLREGISFNDAIEVAESALRCLTKLIMIAFSQYKKNQFHAISCFHATSSSADAARLSVRSALCLNLCQWSSHEPAATAMLGPGPYPDDREWKEDIASLCDFYPEIVEFLLDESIFKTVEQAKEAWCPNASQRLSGRLQDRSRLIGGWETSAAELRAGGEWELLLAEALTITCLDVTGSPEESLCAKVDVAKMKEGQKARVSAQGWRNVFVTAASHLMPAAALLRLGLARVGRKPHPFSFHENNQDPYDVVPLQFKERLSGTAIVSASLKEAVFKTLTALTRLCAEGDDTLTATCHAVAAHLVVDSISFSDLESLQAIRFGFMGLGWIREVTETNTNKEGRDKIVPFLVERLTSVIEDFARIPKSKTSSIVEPTDEFRKLLAFFGLEGVKLIDTIVEDKVESFHVLKTGNFDEVFEEGDEKNYRWEAPKNHGLAIHTFVSALCRDSLRANDRTRSCVALMISRVADLERHLTISSKSECDDSSPAIILIRSVVDAFNEVEEPRLKELLVRDLCGLSNSELTILEEQPEEGFRKDLALLLAFLLAPSNAFTGSRLVFEILVDRFDNWSKLESPARKHVLDVVFLYSARFNALKDIGSKLVTRVASMMDIDTNENFTEIEPLAKFFTFVRDLRAAMLNSNSQGQSNSARSAATLTNDSTTQHSGTVSSVAFGSSDNKSEDTASKTHPRSCSFVLKSGFHGQHWYNCYTCGLVWDKGCCTLCALVCHRGHDVSYSRYSSFFCDCGAEDQNATERNRVSCKCLSLLPSDQVEALFRNEARTSSLETSTFVQPHQRGGSDLNIQKAGMSVGKMGIEIARTSFRKEAEQSIENFVGNARSSPWVDAIFGILRQQFQAWKSANSSKSCLQALLLEDGSADLEATRPMRKISHESLRRLLRNRRSKVLDLQTLSEKALVAVRAAKGFQGKMSSDSTVNARLMARLSKHEISRAAVIADSRGRIIIAEPCALLFCSVIPAVSVRFVNKPCESPLSRSQMCILGKSMMKFKIVGLRMCSENERHVVAWGSAEASVVVLKSSYDSVEETIDLVFDLEQQDGEVDYLVKCEWIPGSQTHVAVGCSRFVRIYDIGRTDSDKRALPVIGYNLGFEAALRDMSIVPYKGYSENEDGDAELGDCTQLEKVSKLFLLLENGRLHVVDLKTGSSGKLESPGDQHFEPSECVVLSTSGVRSRAGSPVGQPGSTSRSLGEGSQLAYLKQSRLLLYKCAASCVLALMLGTKGEVEGSFELIPHVISSEVLGNGPDGYSVTGPFTHWAELGVANRDGSSFFRVACVGKSSRTNQPKLLCLEFNESEVKVKEIMWSFGSSMGLGLSLSLSFEGLAPFSTLILVDNADEGLVFGERAFLCALTSNGSLLLFGEESVDGFSTTEAGTTENGQHITARRRALVNLSSVSGMHLKKPSFPLTIFERLKNVSDTEGVVFGGEGIGSNPDDLKTRLSRDSSVFLMCPKREGCTLTVSLRSNRAQKEEDKAANEACYSHPGANELVIAALRILVGSTSPDCIPSKIFIQGRPVDLTPGVKKWYSLPLTEEEIALSVRNGLVAVGVGPSFDSSNNPLVDSVEVYAVERQVIDKWLPKSYFVNAGKSDLVVAKQRCLGRSNCKESGSPSGLILSAQALTNLIDLLGSVKLTSESERDFLKQLVQDTALDRDKKVSECVESLLERLEPDARARKSFYDESILFGCAKALSRSQKMLEETYMEEEADDSSDSAARLNTVGLVLQDCLNSAAGIARERPMNYLQSMQNIVENGVSSGSIAVVASKIILDGLKSSVHYEDLIGSAGGIVDLSLTEMAIELNTDTPQSKQFAKFDVIRRLLESNDSTIVERCCEAVSTFSRNHGGEQTSSDKPDLFTLLQHARLVAYRCDSCALFPMKEIRYTLPEEDHDLDLCKDCFHLGKEYAESVKFDATIEVVINGRTVGKETKLSCAQMRQMQPVSLEKMDVEQVDVQSTRRSTTSPSEASMDDEEELQIALRLSLGENVEEDPRESDHPIGHQAYEDFVGHLFSSIVDLFSSVLKRDRCIPQVGPLIRLLLDLVRHSRCEDSKVERAKRFAKELAIGVSHLLKAGTGNKKLPQDKSLTLVTCLRAFSNILVPEADSQYYLAESQPDEHAEEQNAQNSKEKASTKFVCQVHNVPAVRRRCARGRNKDRRFYVCGKQRGSSCNYFVWADQAGSETKQESKQTSQFHDIIQSFLWMHFSSGSTPLHVRLCRLLEEEVFGEESEDCNIALSLDEGDIENKADTGVLKSFYGHRDAQRDFADGVFCSREKLQDVVSGEQMLKTRIEGPRVSVSNSSDRGALLLEASLDLLIHIADRKTEGISRWFSLLCEINITTSKPSSLRSLAKKVLKSLCGGKRSLYHSVRDHFAFGFQLKNLFRNSSKVLKAALIIKEKARQCGQNWASSDKTNWGSLCVGALVGTQALISEDAHSQVCDSKISKVLDELWGVIRNRGESWRRFCGLQSLPHSHREKNQSQFETERREGELHLATAPPIVALFWIASVVSGSNQVKMLRLIDFALTNWKDRKSARLKTNASSSEEEIAVDGDEESIAGPTDTLTVPEDILLGGNRKLSIDGIVAFSMHIVYGGSTVDIRRIAYHVVVKLCSKLSPTERGQVFQRLVGPPLGDIGEMGKTSVEFLHLLQSLARYLDSSVPVTASGDLVRSIFMQQMMALKFDRSNGEWAILEAGSGSSVLKKRFDLAPCVNCLRSHLTGAKDSGQVKLTERREGKSKSTPARSPSGASASGTTRGSSSSRSQSHKKWHPEQVDPFVRGRLDGGKDASASNEFCSFYTLKYRLVISDVHLQVNDPRGRFVKTVTVYFSPRPVSDVSVLKTREYAEVWQQCATMSLARGATRASATLVQPVVAANLKIEFTDFYERPGGSKASDGSLLVHCPRCTRVVTNAHGVCGNCGEVAFQCRKCRHINYDRLDAFLCVECGYCASGNFSFELSAAVASNAVAISNDDDFDRAVKILGAATSLHEELRNCLREKIRSIGSRKKTKLKDESDMFSPALKRAFLGLPPVPGQIEESRGVGIVERLEKEGSVVKFVARPETLSISGRTSMSVDRTRSLLRLARQIRSESGSSADRRRSSDVIIRHLGRGLAIEQLEDETDLIGFLEGGSGLDASEPLSRIVASVQSRRRGEANRDQGQRRRGHQGPGGGHSSRKSEANKQIIEECERLHLLMKEAECESYELSRRIQAWKRLENDALSDFGVTEPVSVTYSPSHCSVCAVPVALQLLNLWLRLFQARPSEVHVDREFLSMLLEDVPGISKGLFDNKRHVVREIATKSENGARLVLLELRKRLTATNDVTCAEILGKIMEVEGFCMSEEYAKLAMDVLAAGQSVASL